MATAPMMTTSPQVRLPTVHHPPAGRIKVLVGSTGSAHVVVLAHLFQDAHGLVVAVQAAHHGEGVDPVEAVVGHAGHHAAGGDIVVGVGEAVLVVHHPQAGVVHLDEDVVALARADAQGVG